MSDLQSNARLLKGAAVGFLLLGAFISVWMIDKAIRYPQVKATQFGNEAPYWIPFTIFVMVSMSAAALLFWRAARRIDGGEDPFGTRHRRGPEDL